MSIAGIAFVQADETWKLQVAAFSAWGEGAARHMHFEDGFSLLALREEQLAGYISLYWKDLPAPLDGLCEAYIDILEVHTDFRRQGIAAKLIDLSAERANAHGAAQLRSWSSLDKQDAILMWKALGFGLCPATTFPKGQEVRGYFVTKVLGLQRLAPSALLQGCFAKTLESTRSRREGA